MKYFNSDGESGTEQIGNYKIAYLQAIGGRPEQQDCIGFSSLNEEMLVVLCDGMGGHKGGRLASQVAVEGILSAYENEETKEYSEQTISDILCRMDEEISALADAEGNKLNAGSTAVVAHFNGRELQFFTLGDSRIYLFSQKKLTQLSVDMNYRFLLNNDLSTGKITRTEFEQEMIHGEELISFLGMGGLAMLQSSERIVLQSNDKLLLMSDGLYKYVGEDTIENVIRNFSNPEEALIALNMNAEMSAKRKKIGRDNLSVLLINVE